MNSAHRIFLWTVPRSTSTAFERAFLQRSATRVVHEPYSRAFYFGPERPSTRYRDEAIDQTCTYSAADELLLAPLNDGEQVFTKDMAYHAVEHVSPSLLAQFRHGFLIRDPRIQVASLYRMSTSNSGTGWQGFDPSEVGYDQLERIFDMVCDKLGQAPVVVDSADLLENPEVVLRGFCKRLGIRYEPQMLSWEAKTVQQFATWDAWHKDAQESTGFRKPKSQSTDSPSELPEEALRAIENAMPIYERLRGMRVGLNE